MAKNAILLKPTDSERALAAAVHIGSIFSPILLPAISYAVTRSKKGFVSAHARQSLVETLVLKVFLFVAFVCSASYTAYRLWNYYQNDWQGFEWQEFLVRFIVGWIALAILEIINLIVSIRQAIRAFAGKWPRCEMKSSDAGH